MSNKASRLGAVGLAVAIIGAGVTGSLVRQSKDIGPIEAPPVAQTDSRTLVASTDSNPTLSESAFFYRMLELVKRGFVDPVTDEQKLAVGAVRGMVNSLSDPEAIFMPAEQFTVYKASQEGRFEGIGVELALTYDAAELTKYEEARKRLAAWNENGRQEVDGKLEELPELAPGSLIPDVVISFVVPGSPAEKAGLKPGDVIDGVDGKWVMNRKEVEVLNEAFKDFRKTPAARQKYLDLRKRYLERSESTIMPTRVREKILAGSTGETKLSWRVAGTTNTRTATIRKQMVKVTPLQGTSVQLVPGVGSELRSKIGAGQTTLDLTNSARGNLEGLKEALGAVLPKGEYGQVVSDQTNRPGTLSVTGDAKSPAKLTLKVGPLTSDTARIFAMILKSEGIATIQGNLPKDPPLVYNYFELPDGSGYILPTGRFTLAGGKL